MMLLSLVVNLNIWWPWRQTLNDDTMTSLDGLMRWSTPLNVVILMTWTKENKEDIEPMIDDLDALDMAKKIEKKKKPKWYGKCWL